MYLSSCDTVISFLINKFSFCETVDYFLLLIILL